jgi:MFS family permease
VTDAAGPSPSFARRFGAHALAVLFSAADTYVVVLVLPAMMTTYGVSIADLEKATPIVSSYLLGYVVILPLIGALSDRFGRSPLLAAAVVAFSAGSIVTATSMSLLAGSLGRALQGLGGGAMLPLAFASAADRWEANSRPLALGGVGALQELGSLLGPLYGAGIVALYSWPSVFWLNAAGIVAVGALLAPRRAGQAALACSAGCLVALAVWMPGIGERWWVLLPWCGAFASSAALIALIDLRWPKKVVLAALLLAIFCALTQAAQFPVLAESVNFGGAFSAAIGPLSPLEAGAAILVVIAVLTWLYGTREPLRPASALRDLDLLASGVLAAVLSAVVISFASTNPSSSALPHHWPAILGGLAVGVVVLIALERRPKAALLPKGLFRERGGWASLWTSFLVGVALIVVLVDVPIFARTTTEATSQLGAAFVLVRFLIGVPVGALVGGLAASRWGNRIPATIGLIGAAGSLAAMSRWGATTLASPLGPWHLLHPSDPALVACGIGMGATVAPLSTACIDATSPERHGLVSALLVVSRMVGMVVGVSLLTSLGLHLFTTRSEALPSPASLCPKHPLSCPRYDALITHNLVRELDSIFLLAAITCAIAAAGALSLYEYKRRMNAI